jgi:hypothetical protein
LKKKNEKKIVFMLPCDFFVAFGLGLKQKEKDK